MGNKFRARNAGLPTATALTEPVKTTNQAIVFEDTPAPAPTVRIAEEPDVLIEESVNGRDDDKSVEQADQATVEEDRATEPTFDYVAFGIEHNLPEYWTTDNIDEWVATGGNVKGRTEAGSIISDPTRVDRPIATWEKPELLDGIRGRLEETDESQFGEIAKRWRQLCVIPAAWSIRELIDFLSQEITPAKTTADVWINDVTRARRGAHEWSTAELEAWANGQIKAVGEANDMRLGIELNRRMELGQQSQDTETILAAYRRLETGAVKAASAVVVKSNEPEKVKGLTNLNITYITSYLEDYKKRVGPGTRTDETIGLKAQQTLDGVFRYILNLQDPVGFCSAMSQLRDFVKANRDGLFAPTPAFRFTGLLRKDGDVQETHINLITLLQVYTDENKAARKQVDLQYMLSKFPAARQPWLVEFFTRHCN